MTTLPRSTVCVFLAVAGSTVACQAITVDLAVNTNGTINNALFERSSFRPAGSGVIHSFVRIAGNTDTVQGYNTSGRPLAFNENNSPTFTRNLRLSDVPSRTVSGTAYYEFMLDINQTGSSPLLSLDQLKIYTSPTFSQTTNNVNSLGTQRYNMGNNNFVRLNYLLGSGSGQGDMRLLVPISNFAGALSTDAVYLFSQFGSQNANNDGYEEWSVHGGGATIIPLPGPAAMAFAGLTGLAAIRRRR